MSLLGGRPVADCLYLQAENGVSISHAVLLDLQGRVLRRYHQASISKIDLSGFAPGVYLLQVQTPGASRVFKILKKERVLR